MFPFHHTLSLCLLLRREHLFSLVLFGPVLLQGPALCSFRLGPGSGIQGFSHHQQHPVLVLLSLHSGDWDEEGREARVSYR